MVLWLFYENTCENVAVSICKCTEYTEFIILAIVLDAHGPGDVDSITQITLTPPGDGAVIVLRKYLWKTCETVAVITCKCTKYT